MTKYVNPISHILHMYATAGQAKILPLSMLFKGIHFKGKTVKPKDVLGSTLDQIFGTHKYHNIFFNTYIQIRCLLKNEKNVFHVVPTHVDS